MLNHSARDYSGDTQLACSVLPRRLLSWFPLYPVYTMKLARRAGSTSARRAHVVRS